MKNQLRRGLHAKAAALATMLALPAAGLAVDRTVHGAPAAPATPPVASGAGAGPPDVNRIEPAARPVPAGRERLRRELGPQGILQADPRTERPRLVARAGGALTGPSIAPAGEIGLDWLSANAAALGLDAGDLATLEPVRSLRWNGLRHAVFEQRVDGVPVEGGGLAVTVDETGRLLAVTGSPAPDVESAAPATPALGAAGAVERVAGTSPGLRSRAAAPERETTFAGGDRASLVLVPDGGGVRLAWRVLADAGERGLLTGLVDARDGSLLARRDLVRNAGGLAHDHYPGAPLGGTVATRTYRTGGNDPWIEPSLNRLEGDIAHVYSDADASDDQAGPPFIDPPAAADEVPPSSGAGLAANWAYKQQRFEPSFEKMACPPHPVFGCSWDNWTKPFSFELNRRQAAAQAFWFVNRFHDHLEQDPAIAFTDALGNFEASSEPGGDGGDPLHVQVDNGADTDVGEFEGFPAIEYTNQASMAVRPDGLSPRLQLGLFSGVGHVDAIHDVNSADDASIVYHEYAHGLSDRLITNPSGNSVLTGVHGDAMAEGWSDWYALDFLDAEGVLADGAAPDLRLGAYENLALRSQPLDCPPPPHSSPACPGTAGAGPGGYTFDDIGDVASGPEPHADGEIWAETLWQLRSAMVGAHGRAAGIARTRTLVTGAMMLLQGSGASPTFTDIRDLMLVVSDDPDDEARVWAVFASRGMGAGADADGPDDTTPTVDFDPPAEQALDDEDGDAIVDDDDNCLALHNPDQADADEDGQGDACDPADDADGVLDAQDNCPTTTNDDQADSDGDGLGDACDPDDDSDGLADVSDNCPLAFEPGQADSDGDGLGDACDPPLNTGPGPGPGPTDPEPDPPEEGSPPGKASFRGAARRVRVTRAGRFSIAFRAGPRLRGVASLRSRRPRLTVERRSFSVPASGRARLRVKLSRRELRILRRRRALRLSVSVRLANDHGTSTASMRLTLLAPRRSR
jgi:extracellular elastinolytic metalloproteinase